VDRCHRIGQTKEVDVRRLCVKNSIDERIRELQETKRRLADGALGEGEGGRLGRLSIGDLIRLFNVNGTGEDD
jgi:SNF2 family DNA or RNA helicase